MKKTEASKAKRHVNTWMNKRKREMKKEGLSYDMYRLTVEESSSEKGWWGVRIYTDGEVYEDLYESPTIQKRLEIYLNKKMKWKNEDHYLEPYGQGILDLY